MKLVSVIFCVIINLAIGLNAQTGVDCANAIPLAMDGVARNYSTSASTGSSVICTSYTGTSAITYFSFTTNSTPDKVLIEIVAPTAAPCEVAIYTNSCATLYSSNSMCFDDGQGLWAFGNSFPIQANTTYKMRIKTSTTGTIRINAKYYTPSNNLCSGATAIGETPITDNNACNSAGSGINPADVCAGTLENTAFYKYAVATDGVSIVNINNIQCDNGNNNNSNGFQIGFFTGSCSSLSPISCYSDAGGFVTATTLPLTAGTEVYVAIDGSSGANCQYEISVVNGNILAIGIDDFTGIKKGITNLLKWTSLKETDGNYYEIQRSENKKDYITIGRINSLRTNSENTNYEYEDEYPALVSFYRIKYIDESGKTSYSKIVRISRSNNNNDIFINLVNPVRNSLDMQLTTTSASNLRITVMNLMGQVILKDQIKCVKGSNPYTRSVSNLPAGNYYLMVQDGQMQSVLPFIKL